MRQHRVEAVAAHLLLLFAATKMTEYWVSQARHWCEYCKIYINGSKSSIAFHEQGRKHKEIVELFLKDMRKRNRERKIER